MISFVIPAYNEALGIEQFHNDLLVREIKKLQLRKYEIIYVNDGSKDDTHAILSKIADKDKNTKLIDLSKNFGKEIAISAGIEQARGDAIITLDADGQHPPTLLNEFIKKWQDGAQVVVGVRASNKEEGFVKLWGSRLFYKSFNSLPGAEIIPRSTDYRLIDKCVQQELIKFTERNRITRGIVDWLGFKRDYVVFDAPARIAGKPSYKTSQLVRLAMNSFVSLSLTPLFIFGYIGLLITTLAFFAGIFIITEQIILGDPLGLNITGSAMLGLLVSFLVGLVLMSQGIMAVYLSHIYAQAQSRPLYVINRSSSKNIHTDDSIL